MVWPIASIIGCMGWQQVEDRVREYQTESNTTPHPRPLCQNSSKSKKPSAQLLCLCLTALAMKQSGLEPSLSKLQLLKPLIPPPALPQRGRRSLLGWVTICHWPAARIVRWLQPSRRLPASPGNWLILLNAAMARRNNPNAEARSFLQPVGHVTWGGCGQLHASAVSPRHSGQHDSCRHSDWGQLYQPSLGWHKGWCYLLNLGHPSTWLLPPPPSPAPLTGSQLEGTEISSSPTSPLLLHKQLKGRIMWPAYQLEK